MNEIKFAHFTLVHPRHPSEAEFDPRIPVRAGDGFPQDIIEEIICREHPKELCTFKQVSRGFNNLISGKTFLLNNLNKMELLNRSVYIFQKEPAYAPLLYHISGVHRLDGGRVLSPNASEIQILCSAEGLVLYCDTANDFYLFNPLTKQTEVLNYCEPIYPPYSTSAEVFYGMGYVYYDNNYKIIRVSTFNDTNKSTSVMVYSRNHGDWHRAGDLHTRVVITQAGVNICGRLHWRTSTILSRYNITAFDIQAESYTTIQMPHIMPSNSVQQLYSVDSKTLAMCCTLQAEGSIHVIWILRDYFDHPSWYNVQINLGTINNQPAILCLRPLSLIYPERTKLLLCVVPTGQFFVYDIEENEFSNVGYEEVGTGYICAYRFIPTLHSPHPLV